ncbi:putative defense protein 1 [Heterodontus francisci]|uniref:putative defense protein 1 n=1 Tax=Heterodontus francisci TaxID=7792 RepID=UPI00355AD08D
MEKAQFRLALLGLFALCWPAASPLPNGAPLGSCLSMSPKHRGITPQTGESPHSIQLQVSRSSVQVNIMGPTYKGILLEARYPSGNTTVGMWATAPANTKTISCFNSDHSAITHSNTNDKSSTTVYTWNPPPLKNCSEKTFVFLATVAQNRGTYWLKLTSNEISLCSSAVKNLSGFAVLATFMIAGLAAF